MFRYRKYTKKYLRRYKHKRKEPAYSPFGGLFRWWLFLLGFFIILIVLLGVFGKLNRNEELIERRVFELVNEEREKFGVHKLILDSTLNKLAKEHSTKMLEEGFLEHSKGDIGENIVEVPIWYDVDGCGLVITNNQIAKCIMGSWKESFLHYSNMIDSGYMITGIGVSCNILECKGTQNFL